MLNHHLQNTSRLGFTLIELSVVLVIIGLIVGGILVGRDLISAAAMRAQISQIEKYNTAANTFFGKYGYLPGDIPAGPAALFGFAARGSYAGEGDGNGVIEGVSANTAGSNSGYYTVTGETAMFWVDLSLVNLINAGLNTASSTVPYGGSTITGSTIPKYLPSAMISAPDYMYVWSRNSINYFGLSNIVGLTNTCAYSVTPTSALSVYQAYSIDSKIDDGLPGTGRVTAEDTHGCVANWPTTFPDMDSGTGSEVGSGSQAVSASSSTCMDNGGVHHTTVQYSMAQSGGAGMNCALSFQFQGAGR